MSCCKGEIDVIEATTENERNNHYGDIDNGVIKGTGAGEHVSEGETGCENVDEEFSYDLYYYRRFHADREEDVISDGDSYCVIETLATNQPKTKVGTSVNEKMESESKLKSDNLSHDVSKDTNQGLEADHMSDRVVINEDNEGFVRRAFRTSGLERFFYLRSVPILIQYNNLSDDVSKDTNQDLEVDHDDGFNKVVTLDSVKKPFEISGKQSAAATGETKCKSSVTRTGKKITEAEILRRQTERLKGFSTLGLFALLNK